MVMGNRSPIQLVRLRVALKIWRQALGKLVRVERLVWSVVIKPMLSSANYNGKHTTT